jgi:hypothetical protein
MTRRFFGAKGVGTRQAPTGRLLSSSLSPEEASMVPQENRGAISLWRFDMTGLCHTICARITWTGSGCRFFNCLSTFINRVAVQPAARCAGFQKMMVYQ